MASKSMMVLLLAVVAAAVVPYVTAGIDYTVGDEEGWSPKVNYTQWAAGKKFFVGDMLVFIYPAGKHNVYKATAQNFRTCTVPTEAAPLRTGNDMITLASPGKKWYICGVKGHCAMGQKLVINVLPASLAPTPPPTSPPQSDGAMVSAYPAVLLAGFVAVVMRALY